MRSAIRGGREARKPSPNSALIMAPYCAGARLDHLEEGSSAESIVCGSVEPALWNWLSKARIAARRTSMTSRDVHDETAACGR